MAGQSYRDIGVFRSIWRYYRKQILRLKPSAYETVAVPLVSVLRKQDVYPLILRLEKKERIFKANAIQHYFKLVDN